MSKKFNTHPHTQALTFKISKAFIIRLVLDLVFNPTLARISVTYRTAT